MKKFPGVTWLIGGQAGWGINVSAEILSKVLLRLGYYVFSNIEYESLIRGGHSYYRVRFSDEPIHSHLEATDILLALDDATIIGDGGRHTHGHIEELHRGSILIFDGKSSRISESDIHDISDAGIMIIDLPMSEIVSRNISSGNKRSMIMRNSVGIGATAYILKLDLDMLFEVVRDRFGSKRKSVIEENVSLIINGYEYVEKNYNDIRIEIPRIAGNHKKRLTTGNYMATLGSIKAGLKVWVHYPMTPSTPILYYMNQFKDRYGIVVMQPESEIAVIHIALGASYGGARAGVGTSGGGFALMSEGIGFAGMAEIPIVIFEVSRPGPSTGLPTRTEQGDLFEVLYPSQGVYPKCVIAPGDPEEVYRDSFIAYNIAEKYQMPVIVHYDKHLAESLYTVGIDDEIGLPIERWKLADEEGGGEIYYMRYRDEPDGVSPIRKLGDGISLWTGLEHDEHGLFSEEPHNRLKMMRKRDRKMRTLYDEMMDRKDIYKPINVYGEGDIVLIGWGSTKGVILDSVRYLNRYEGHRFKFLQIRWIQPFPKELFLDEIKDSMFKIIIENNFDGQMERLIRQETGIDIDHSIRKYDGRCFSLDGLYNEVYRVVSRWKG